MNPPTIRRGVLALAAVPVLVMTSSCSSADDTRPGVDPDAPMSEERNERPVGALDKYLGVGSGIEQTTDEAAELAYQEAIARCMAEEGFEYVPFVLAATTTVLGDGMVTLELESPELPDLPPDEFAAQYGYGISTAPSTDPGAAESQEDPNNAIVARMSVAERVAYHHTLYGRTTPLDDQGNLQSSISVTPESCSGRADKEVPDDSERARIERRVEQAREAYADLLERVGDLREEELADPRVVAATAEWSRCLAAAGFPGFDELEEPRQQARADALRVLGPEMDATTADPAQVSRLRRDEVRLAVADNECLEPWQETYDAVRLQLEEEFVRANIDELEDYRAALTAALSPQG